MSHPAGETRPVSFGFGLAPYARFTDAAEIVETVVLAEELGYATVGLPEHLLPPASPAMPEPFHQRGAMTDEYLRAMKVLWTADRPSFSGTFVSFDDALFLPRPSGIPLCIGGMAEPSFRRVAEYGDGWYPMTDSPDVLRAGVARIVELRTERGRADAALDVVCSLMVAEDPQLAVLRRHVRSDPDGVWSDGGTAHGAPEPPHPQRLPPSVGVERARELVDAGATLVMAKFAWANAAGLHAELRWFAANVMSAFQ